MENKKTMGSLVGESKCMNANNIGDFIKSQRIKNGLSQYQLADKIPISRQAVSKWERGQSIPDSSTLLRLSDIFGVTINELLLGKNLNTNQMKELEDTTLTLLDESNKMTKKNKRTIFFFRQFSCYIIFYISNRIFSTIF